MVKIVVATGNPGKVVEIREIFEGLPIELITMGEIWDSIPDIPETGVTFLDNATIKADWVYDRTQLWTLADDSGLEVDVLDGAPGVRSARYAGEGGGSAANNAKLLSALADLPFDRRIARFRCCIVLKRAPDAYMIAEGVCEGHIGFQEQGRGGFGYDPLFIPCGYDRTFAQLSSAEKNTLSHRGKALRTLKEKLYALL